MYQKMPCYGVLLINETKSAATPKEIRPGAHGIIFYAFDAPTPLCLTITTSTHLSSVI